MAPKIERLSLELTKDNLGYQLLGTWSGKVAPSYLGVVIYKAPTNNCQIYSISGIQQILEHENYLEILNFIQAKIAKTELLLDIVEAYDETDEDEYDEDTERYYEDTQYPDLIENCFEEDGIIFKQQYQNNTRSKMIMYLFQTKKLKRNPK